MADPTKEPAAAIGFRNVPVSDLDALVSACEETFGTTDLDFRDDEDVSHPPSGITFGMIRRAREAIDAAE